ncbi:MAG: hypothetical protein LBK55_04235 [Azoarcus sp.]|jgi:hypothetical protein|nr:hypothetical protein [Azoarcus sp.]
MVAFATGAPTAEEIICLYLYDDIKPPAPGTLKTKQDVLNLAKPTRQDVEIDKDWFMKHGGGRFMHIGRFDIVRNFLAKKDPPQRALPLPPKGQVKVYSTSDIFDAYGVSRRNPARWFGLKQYEYDLDNNDFVDRCEVFGSSNFEINKWAQFIVKTDGTREIHSICVEPVEDDYDYTSSSWEAKVSNTLTESMIDPWNIGRKIIIKFTGNIHSVHNFSWMDLPMLENQNNRLKALQASSFKKALKFPELHTKKMMSLAAKSILYWKMPFVPVLVPTPVPIPMPLPVSVPIARDA